MTFLASLKHKINSLYYWIAFYAIHPILKSMHVLGSATVVGNLKIIKGYLMYF
jgi:hypothetical protein